ncbi:beta-aspartyl-peptidase [Bifidobacterium sp.]|jgi:beta-aspartyl-dipeptidase (metallo-type)|uniref:beta-aspartyl-peptidase n=1 Tax=Bifidobacterium sp. TaxID=41200 RepID=UPI0025BB2002|nr:beta-aspartyl-peptidase [Bifidobacterium sp.]MCH4209715.1 beta-aspartyl-peptidase [Bifidobacterium sp.]MCI1224515.1 beta-aspartyl-peptidase [Bifidobacterium sp.]
MILVTNAHVYAPKDLGLHDILIAGGKILRVADKITLPAGAFPDLQVVDAAGRIVAPGFIDNHVHVVGGGGESGFNTMAPEVMLSEFVRNGVTTCMGLLGTNGITRTPRGVYAKVRALNKEGITAYMYTGSYSYPSVTITGSVADDITFIDEVIGVKLALSDHRGSFVTYEELLRLASQARIAGMLADKAGVILAHMGEDPLGLDLVLRAVRETSLPAKTIHPTHVNRIQPLLQQAFEYAKLGGFIDLSCSDREERSVCAAIQDARSQGVPLDQITISSDANGSTSTYDPAGNLLSIGVLTMDCMHSEFQRLVASGEFSLPQALSFFTSNVARSFSLPAKGRIAEGLDADLLFFDTNEELTLETVIAKGELMMTDRKILRKGTYE